MLPEIDEGKPLIFSGRFGSGKTEIALNYAVQTAHHRDDCPILVDLDIVTPYFRTREMMAEMYSHKVKVVAPLEIARSVDVPAVTPQILGAIEQNLRPVILDVGGDGHGARALARYSTTLYGRGYNMCFVVNPYRPFTRTCDEIAGSVKEIERSSRLRVSSLVSNPNLMKETNTSLVQEGHRIVEASAKLLGLPVSFIVISARLVSRADMVENLSPELPVLPLERYFMLPWE